MGSGVCHAGWASRLGRGEGAARVVALSARYVEWARRHPHLYSVMFQRAIPEFVVDDAQRAIANRVFERLVQACRGNSPEPEIAARAIWQYSHGVVSLEIARIVPAGPTMSDRVEVDVRRKLGG